MATATTKKIDPIAIAGKFYTLANAMQAAIDDKRRPLSQNPTPKRMKEYMSRKLDGDNLERGQRALRALADAWLRGDVPLILQGLRTKAEIVPLVRHGLDSSGYYDVHSTGKYADQSPEGKALQSLLDNSANGAERAQDAERERLAKIERMENELRFCDIPGFFPTPRPLIERMVDLAKLDDDSLILEPSAGKGDIVDEIMRREPHSIVDCIEVVPRLRDILKSKSYRLVADDFMRFVGIREVEGTEYECPSCGDVRVYSGTPRDINCAWCGGMFCAADRIFDSKSHVARYDRILMNPPFERGQDAEHVQHAYSLLAPGGRIVALTSTGPFSRQNRMSAEFRAWLETLDNLRTMDVEEDAFKGVQAFRQTGVRVKLVVIDKP